MTESTYVQGHRKLNGLGRSAFSIKEHGCTLENNHTPLVVSTVAHVLVSFAGICVGG